VSRDPSQCSILVAVGGGPSVVLLLGPPDRHTAADQQTEMGAPWMGSAPTGHRRH
jgi:hypothetical protein